MDDLKLVQRKKEVDVMKKRVSWYLYRKITTCSKELNEDTAVSKRFILPCLFAIPIQYALDDVSRLLDLELSFQNAFLKFRWLVSLIRFDVVSERYRSQLKSVYF